MTDDFFLRLSIEKASALSATIIKDGGLLGTHNSLSISHRAIDDFFSISISQNGIRTIEVRSSAPTRACNLWSLLHDILRLCMLFEGEFLQMDSAVFYLNEDKVEWSDKLTEEYRRRTLPIYNSADYTKGSTSEFVCPLDALSDDVMNRWVDIESELDIVHPMVLYGMSNLEVPVDLKTALLVEAFEPLFELIKQHHADFTMAPAQSKPNGEKDSKLRRILVSIIQKYGLDIFEKETAKDIHSFCQVLVNSRNRMFHIKTRSEKLYLGGNESVLYAAKLSVLYRRILLDLMGISYDLYKEKLKENMNRWDTWNGVLDGFLVTRWTE